MIFFNSIPTFLLAGIDIALLKLAGITIKSPSLTLANASSIELYLINSIAAGIFALFYERFVFILIGTIVLFFLGRASLPYWSEIEDDELD